MSLGADGSMGLIGPRGERGETGRDVGKVTLTYANISFIVWVEPSTVQMIEDEQALNQGDLDLIEVVNKEDWLAIRKACCDAWQMKKAHRAFELGDMEDENF